MAFPLLDSSHVKNCVNILDDCILPEFKGGNERPLEVSDFDQINVKFENSAKQISDLLKADSCNDSDIEAVSSEFIVLLLIHCGENFKESLWTSKSTLELCKSSYMLVFGSEESCQSLLLEDQAKILKQILLKLRPCLLSTSWKCYPTAVHCYIWCLNSIRAPYLGEHLDLLLPTSLIITDDFTVENKIAGIKCLHHIINNVTLTELLKRSYNEVIYKALETCLLERNADLIPVLVSCLLSLLRKMYFLSTDHYSKWTHYDEVLTKYLYNLKLEGNISIKQSMLESLIKIISSSGLICVRYLGNIVEIVDESSVNYSTVLLALKVILEVLAVCSPCIEHHLKQITFIVLKVMYSSNSYKPLTVEEIREACKEVLIRINSSDSTLLQELTTADQFDQLDCEIQSVIEEVVNIS